MTLVDQPLGMFRFLFDFSPRRSPTSLSYRQIIDDSDLTVNNLPQILTGKERRRSRLHAPCGFVRRKPIGFTASRGLTSKLQAVAFVLDSCNLRARHGGNALAYLWLAVRSDSVVTVRDLFGYNVFYCVNMIR